MVTQLILKSVLLSAGLLLLTTVQAQNKQLLAEAGSSTLGIGMGLPYGGIGANISTNVADNFAFFGAIGYQIAGVGYNIGTQYTFDSKKEASFYLSGMYGTNGASYVVGADFYNDVFTGASFGAGIKLASRKTEGNFWDFGLVYPIHSKAFDDRIDAISNDSNVSEFAEPWPVLIAIGYHFHL